MRILSKSAAALLLLLPLGLAAADQNSPEAKLRESLRNTMLQARNLQVERDTLQAAKDQLEADKKELQDKYDALVKQAAADQQKADKQLSDTQNKLAEAEKQGVTLQESLDKWKASQQQAVEMLKAKEDARLKLTQQNIELLRRVEDQRVKNQEMFKLGLEVLSRYEKFGLGTALTAREPFVGTTRVKFQNLVQDYADKMADQRVKQ